jgi:hypothetical protein
MFLKKGLIRNTKIDEKFRLSVISHQNDFHQEAPIKDTDEILTYIVLADNFPLIQNCGKKTVFMSNSLKYISLRGHPAWDC